MKWVVLGLVSAALAVFLNDRFVFESVLVPSSSMRPTLLPNERAFLRRVAYMPLHRFDIIVIASKKLGHRIVKRLIGLPGECVQLKDSWQVLIDGKSLDYADIPGEVPIKREASLHTIQLQRNPKFFYKTEYGAEPLCLGQDEYYVLGDNRLASGDSRAIGPVGLEEIQGVIVSIWYSYDKDAHHLRTDRVFKMVN